MKPIKTIVIICAGSLALNVIQYYHTYQQSKIHLPEELNQVTWDSANPDPLYGHQDSSGIYIEMRNYKK